MKWVSLIAGLFVSFGFCGAANATLIDRGSGFIYDDVLNITWLQDADLCSSFGNCINDDGSGRMAWDDAIAWVTALIYEGFDDFRRP